jgi:cellulose synthase operon protein C
MTYFKFIRSYFVLMLALLVTGTAYSQTQGGVDILLAKARSLELRGRVDLAAQNWQKVLLANPNQTEALAGLARAAREDGRANDERSYLDRLRKINPRDPQIAIVEKMHVLTQPERNRLDQAGRLAMQHKNDEAMKVYHEVFGNQPPPPGKWTQPYYETEAASTGGRPKAIAQLRQLCAQNPNFEIYRMWLASQLTYDPKTRMEGIQIFESIKDPAVDEQAKASWHRALLWEKENPDVLASLEAYLQRYPDPDLQPFAAALHAKQQQNVADANKAIAFKALRNKDVETAAARFTEVLRQSPNDPNAIVGLGYVRLDQKRFNEALSLFDRARTLAPQRQDAREGYDNARFLLALQRGSVAERQNQPEAAVMAYQEALNLRPMDSDALLGLANAFLKEKKFPDAEARFQQVLNRSPNNADAIAGLGFVRLNEGRFDDASRLLASAKKLDPSRKDIDQDYDNATFWGIMNRAATALNQNRIKEAVTAYQQALKANPNNRDALLGLANASVRAGDFPTAAKTYYRLTAADPNDESSWLGLIKAQMGEKAPAAAISTVQHIPSAVKLKLEGHSDYLSELALVYYEARQPDIGEQFLRRAMAKEGQSDSDDALSTRMEIAGQFMEQGNTGHAVEIYRQITQAHPNNPSGWKGLVGAYTRLSNFQQAVTAVRSMPQASYEAALKDAGFLDSVAVLYSNQGQCTEAEDFLHRSIALDQSQGRQPAESTQLQLADVWMREHNYSHARDLYSEMVAKNANSGPAWRGYLAVLHQQGDDHALVNEIPKIPASVRTEFEADPSFLILEASAYSNRGRNPDAVQLLQQARSRYATQRQQIPAVLDLQTAWTMLAASVDTPGLGDLLRNDKRRTDLTSKQREAFEEIYSDWTVRRAEEASEAKPELALSVLTNGAQEYPSDRNIHAALASLYLKRHDKQKALEVYQSWGMMGAQAGDYRVAVGAALSAHKVDLADQYLHRGLERYPQDPELMHMAARQDIERGNYDEGERELRSALLAAREQGQTGAAAKPKSDSKSIGTDVPSEADHVDLPVQTNSTKPAPSCKAEAPRNAANEARIQPMNLVLSRRRNHGALLQYVSMQEPPPPQQPAPTEQQPQPRQQQQTQQSTQPSQAEPGQQQQQEQMEDEVEAVENRNTPVITIGGVGTGRIGDPGIDQLIIGDTLLGSTYTASNRARLGIEGHGVVAYSGTPDGSSSLMFGTLPASAVFGEQSKFGYSGLAQLSTNTFGMSFGTTPQGFAIHNLIGGIRYRPLNGWLTIEGLRDSVKDSLLSYAGARDPGTDIRWGGVVSNTGTVRVDSAPSSNVRYKTIGEYASGSYSLIQGRHVPDNWSVSGNAGLYWQVVQGLTVGVNANVMHYDKNLKYFSFGQGGYFSPQAFYLASIPISWYSRHPRFEYEFRFSGGAQYLHEAASQFYPVQPGSAIVTQGVYASNSSIAPNYDASIRIGYRIAPHVYLDTFATANNSRNYYTQSAGFNLRFMMDRIPTSTGLRVNTIPDWTGKQPFSVK